MGFDKKEHTTVKGKVVYFRKKNFFTMEALKRIIERTNFPEVEYEELVEWIIDTKFPITAAIQRTLINLVVNILDSFLPAWVGNLVEWVYDNVDAGRPPWIPPDITL